MPIICVNIVELVAVVASQNTTFALIRQPTLGIFFKITRIVISLCRAQGAQAREL
jgi:hypothetical protein